MTATVAICIAVFAGSLLISWRLGQFLKDCDNRDADRQVVAEAERILQAAQR